MPSSLTQYERKLAAVLPCTAAAAITLYSRWWRTQDRRPEAMVQATALLAFILVAIWLPHVSRPAPEISPLSDWMRWTMATFGLFAGHAVGCISERKTSSYLQAHWMNWCLRGQHRRKERWLRLLAMGLFCALTMAFTILAASNWLAFTKIDIATVIAASSTGFLLPSPMKGRARLRTIFTNEHKVARHFPTTLLLQASYPRLMAACVTAATFAVATVAALSVRTNNANLLIFAMAIAIMGFAFCASLLSARAAALRALIGWTEVSPWRAMYRLMWPPIVTAACVAAPIALAGMVLDRVLWSGLALVFTAISAYGAVIWVVDDLIRANLRGNQSFHVANYFLLLAGLCSGPFAALIVPLHLGWLVRRGNRAWQEGL